MSDLDELKAKLADVVVENNFPLERERLRKFWTFYSDIPKKFPLPAMKILSGGDFWFNGITPQQLSDIYTGITPADKIYRCSTPFCCY
ncbi:hypothetical protein CWS02_00540 [Enterobacter sp. EA-1]|nr:hypothetical protein CWS02_00540 [Enterobacter sp. EA-1]